MLNNTLLPTAYFAPISYYAILLQHPNCSVELHENFVKQSIRNRCDIYGANGKLQLTIPKQRKRSDKTIIKEIQISYKQNWQKEHWNAIVSSYNSSPFFEYYKDEFLPFFEHEEILLIDFNKKLQIVTLRLLQEDKNITPTNEYLHQGNFSDLRNHNWNLEKQERYDQVFMEKHGFIANLSILDLLCNLGPESTNYLRNLSVNIDI
ncbi:WbqC family protein [Flavobacteriales bacterium]|nr:WbqC family protein [Flavobacteriales bacterium]